MYIVQWVVSIKREAGAVKGKARRRRGGQLRSAGGPHAAAHAPTSGVVCTTPYVEYMDMYILRASESNDWVLRKLVKTEFERSAQSRTPPFSLSHTPLRDHTLL